MLPNAQDAATRIQWRWRAKRIVLCGCWAGRAATVRTNQGTGGTFSPFWTHVRPLCWPAVQGWRVRALTSGFKPKSESSGDRLQARSSGLDAHRHRRAGLQTLLVERELECEVRAAQGLARLADHARADL